MELESKTLPLPNRRANPRSECNYSAIVNGHDVMGEVFAEKARIVNISANGAFMYMYRPIMVSTKIKLAIKVPAGSPPTDSDSLSTAATVVRCNMYPSGACGVAVRFK